MNRAAITGIGYVGPAGQGIAALDGALRARSPLGQLERIETLRGRAREMRVARTAPFDRESFLPSRKLRRMGEASQVWVIACQLARADAGLKEAGDGDNPCPPDRRGTYLGTGFGCTDATWEYLTGMFMDGPGLANPFLFSESVANAAAGHGAIEFDTRGCSLTFTCGDASALTAVEFAARAIRDGRVEMAYCGGVEVLSQPLVRVLSTIASPSFAGEGCICFLLESFDFARARGARIHGELIGGGLTSDPAAGACDWSRDPGPMRAAMRRAIDASAEAEPGIRPPISRVFLHACGAPATDAAEREAAASVGSRAELREITSITGTFAAAGGIGLAAALGAGGERSASDFSLVNSLSWGGGSVALLLRSAARPADVT